MESDLDSIRVCALCKKMCVEPRSLTCLHSFCLQCLLQSIKGKNINLEKTLSCALCDEEYVVPKEGLRRNDFIYRLIKDDESTPSSKDRILCTLCPKDKENPESEIPLATSYCIDCEQEMCDCCNKAHSGHNSGKTHRVFGLGRHDDEELAKDKRYDCPEHPRKKVELFCKRCEAVICITCFAETHKHHDCIDLDKYIDQLRDQMEKNCGDATSCLNSCNTMKDQLDAVEQEFLGSVDEAKANIDERCKELKKMVDRHAQKLHEELERTRKRKQKQTSEHREPLDNLIANLKTLKAYCSELASKGTSVEITRDIAGINDRNRGLQRLQEQHTERKVGSLNVFFKPKELKDYEQYGDNSVGSVGSKITTLACISLRSMNSSCLKSKIMI